MTKEKTICIECRHDNDCPFTLEWTNNDQHIKLVTRRTARVVAKINRLELLRLLED